MHPIDELLHWERGSHASYAQMPLLDCGFCFIIRSQLDVGCSPLCHARKGAILGISSTGRVPGQTFPPTLPLVVAFSGKCSCLAFTPCVPQLAHSQSCNDGAMAYRQ
jgi:hypothetical protein